MRRDATSRSCTARLITRAVFFVATALRLGPALVANFLEMAEKHAGFRKSQKGVSNLWVRPPSSAGASMSTINRLLSDGPGNFARVGLFLLRWSQTPGSYRQPPTNRLPMISKSQRLMVRRTYRQC